MGFQTVRGQSFVGIFLGRKYRQTECRSRICITTGGLSALPPWQSTDKSAREKDSPSRADASLPIRTSLPLRQAVAQANCRPGKPSSMAPIRPAGRTPAATPARRNAGPPLSPRWPSPRSAAAGPPCGRTCHPPPAGPGASPARSRGRPPAPRPCPRWTRCACGARSPAWSCP